MLLSFVIPVYHGEATITKLFTSLQAVCQANNYSFEVIFVWDCGPDNSWNVISELKHQNPEIITAIRLSRNYGQHNAIICGFEHAIGDYIITMDEDLQHDPADVPLLLNKQQEADYDLVYGYYPEREHSGFRNMTSRLLNTALKIGIPELHRHYSAFRCIKKKVALSTIKMQNSYTFLDGYFAWITNNVSSTRVNHQARFAGKSSYNLKKLITHTINIFVTFSSLPIKLVSILSAIFFFFSTTYATAIIIKKIFSDNLVPGFASIIVLTGYGFSAILFGLSVIGEYIHRINLKTTRRPNYNINEIL
jgi:undecaprenyl-phosphate 4-deoxy-4-formamido-L-arabinose transferase